MNADERRSENEGPRAKDHGPLSKNLILALEFAEDFALADCIETGEQAVLIYRDTAGRCYRRLIGRRGVCEIAETFDDATVLARMAATRHASPADQLAMDAAIAQAQADGDLVVVIPQ